MQQNVFDKNADSIWCSVIGVYPNLFNLFSDYGVCVFYASTSVVAFLFYNILERDYSDYGTIPCYDGETPTKENTPEYSYVFEKWSPEIQEINGETVYIAQFKPIPNEYTITFFADEKIVTSIKYTVDSKNIENPAIPEKTGYSAEMYINIS